MPKLTLELDPAFKDFNFSSKWDPGMRKRPTEAELIALAYLGAVGDSDALEVFADAMFYTLRAAAFDGYQRYHGPLGISHEDWYYAKLQQFFKILIYGHVSITGIIPDDVQSTTVRLPRFSFTGIGFAYIQCCGDIVDADEIKGVLAPGTNDPQIWIELARTVSKARGDRLYLAQEWLQSCRKRQRSVTSSGRGWGKIQERNSVIIKCLKEGMNRSDICRELDKRTISTIPALEKRGIPRWVDGWEDPQRRRSIQTLFSKVKSKRLSSPS